MVTLPTLDVSQSRPIEPSTQPLDYPRNIGRPGAVGEAISEVGASEQRRADEQRAANDQSELATARSAFLLDKANAENDVQTNPDWQNSSTRYRATMDEAAQRAAATISNERARKEFLGTSAVETAEGLRPILGFVREKQRGQDRGDLDNLLDANMDNALKSPQNANAVVQATGQALDAAVAKGTIDPADAVSMRRKWVESYGKSWIALQSPQDQVKILTGRASGAPETSSVADAILQQESGGNPNAPTSPTGAVGPGQVEPATFSRFALPGEDIKNPKDNEAVSRRYVDYLAKLPNVQGDPGRIAVGYYSGEGNIAPLTSATPYLKDKTPPKGVKGPTTSQYVAQVVGRIGQGGATSKTYDAGASLQEATGTPADFIPLPERAVIAREADRQVRAEGAGQRSSFMDSTRDTIEYLHAGGDPAQAKITPDQVRATIPGEEGAQAADELGHAFDYAKAARTIATAPQSEVDHILANHLPTGPEGFRASAAEEGALVKAAQDRQKQIYGDGKTPGDPAGYATQNFPDVQKSYAAGALLASKDPSKFANYVQKVTGAQTALGVPADAQRILPRADAEAIVGQLRSGDPKNALGLLQAMHKEAGNAFPRVYADLARAGLPSSFQALVVAEPKDAQTMASALGQDASGRLSKGAPMSELMRGVKYDTGDGKAPKSVTDLVEQQMALDTGLQQLRASYGIFGRAGAESFDGVYDAVRTTALYLFQTRGLSPADATTQAAKMVTGQFDFVQQPGYAPLRLPSGKTDDFTTAAKDRLESLQASDLKPLPVEMDEQGREIAGRPESERADQALTHARNAYWVAVPGADGRGAARAFDPQSQTPVMLKNGKPLEIPFSSMGSLAVAAKKKSQTRASRDADIMQQEMFNK